MLGPVTDNVLDGAGREMTHTTQDAAGVQAPEFVERRKNTGKRHTVAYGIVAGQNNVVAGVEYLQSRNVESHIIHRVILQLLVRRLALKKMDERASLASGL
jgi:hypothetical protein